MIHSARFRAAILLSVTFIASAGCSSDPELVFADWHFEVPGAPAS